jgi:periplasmic copper chaperone A
MWIRSAIVAALLGLALGGCDGGAAERKADPAAQPAADTPAGVTLSGARVQLPAVSGRPGAAYFTISQAAGGPRTITAVTVAMAGRSEMHETVKRGGGSAMKPLASVPLAGGETVTFAPGGRHVMLFDLDPKLRFEDDVELTVTFADGAKARVRAPVTTVQQSMEGMP